MRDNSSNASKSVGKNPVQTGRLPTKAVKLRPIAMASDRVRMVG